MSTRFVTLNHKLNLTEFATSSGAVQISSSSETFIHSMSVDSRELEAGTLFIALKGENVDGHDFLDSIINSDAFGAMIDVAYFQANAELAQKFKDANKVLLLAKNALFALQKAAATFLGQFGKTPKIGVTGSSGKTTVKEMIQAVLASKYKIWFSPGNMNSVIGLPLAIFTIPKSVEFLVFEMAMSEKGEMSILSDMIKPNIAVITNIGLAHIAQIGSQDGIAFEKKQISKNFNHNDILYIPEDEPYLKLLSEDISGELVLFGPKNSSGFKGSVINSYDGQILNFDEGEIKLSYLGEHIQNDALVAIEIGRKYNIPFSKMKEALETFVLPPLRGELLKGKLNYVLDCYNANPSSMEASIRSFANRIYTGNKIVIVGDMLELGNESKNAHEKIGEIIGNIDFQKAFFYGIEMKYAYDKTIAINSKNALKKELFYCETFDILRTCSKQVLKNGDLVLLKASRGMKLEVLVEEMEGV